MASLLRASLVIFLCACCGAKKDENLLEEISQLEIFAKEFRREIFEIRNVVESKLRDLKRKDIDYLQYYFGLKTQSRKKMETAVKKSEKKVMDLIQTLKHDRRDLRPKVKRLEVIFTRGRGSKQLEVTGARDVPDISFRASVPEKTRFRGVENFTFTKSMENVGQGYDNDTGIFTAPLTGTYLFVFYLCLGGNYVDLSIMKGKYLYSWARFFPYHLSCQNLDLITTVEAGDTVFVKHISSWDYSVVYSRNELSSTFSGVLIS